MADGSAGWYPDPSGDASRLRYWDGAQWTSDYSTVQPAQPQVVIQETTYTSGSGYQTRVDQVYVEASFQDRAPVEEPVRLAAFIFCLISTISAGWLLVPLAWMIPMTVHTWGLYKGTKRNTIGFGVCTLIFVNVIAGILLLVSGEDA